MKKYIYFFLPLLACLVACDDLDKYPKDSVSSEVYFKNASQLEQYSNQFYTLFPSAASMYNEVSDEIALSNLADEAKGVRTVPADNSGTNWSWGMLRHINYMIEHIDQCDDKAVATEYLALARFFRAYFYYDKIRHYGDVPWIDHTLGSGDDQLYAARDSRKVVMEHVIADLDYAIMYMTDDRSNNYRANCYAAMALKSRVCLFEGTFRKYHNLGDWEPMLEAAADAAKKLMDAGVYKLYEEGDNSQAYRHLFTMGTYNDCDEYIMARCYNLDLKLNHNVSGFTLSPTTGKPGFTKRFVNQYLNADGTRFTDRPDYKTVGIGEEMTNRDPRMEQTILRPGHYTRIGDTELVEYKASTSATGYQLIKYVMDKSTDTYNQSDCDMPLFRLAEVYLNYAEAKAELGQFTDQEAAISINKLRRRANMPDMDVALAASTPCPFMASLYPNAADNGIVLEIRRERDIELVQEGFRYWDLMRWKEGKAFEQPYLGISFAGVSCTADDESGFVDADNDGYPDICAWRVDFPFRFGVDYLKVNDDVLLTDSIHGGNILCCGSIDQPNGGRHWNEERDYLYPIPRQERILTSGVISQNPGWDDGLSF